MLAATQGTFRALAHIQKNKYPNRRSPSSGVQYDGPHAVLEPVFPYPGGQFFQALADRTSLPLLEGDRFRGGQIRLEHRLHLGAEILPQDDGIDFIVMQKA